MTWAAGASTGDHSLHGGRVNVRLQGSVVVRKVRESVGSILRHGGVGARDAGNACGRDADGAIL